jgi:hypothetical protein
MKNLMGAGRFYFNFFLKTHEGHNVDDDDEDDDDDDDG